MSARYFPEILPPMMAVAPDPGMMQPRQHRRVPRQFAAFNNPTMGSSFPEQPPKMAVLQPALMRPARRERRRPLQTASDAMAMSGGMSFGDTSLVAEARRWIGGNPTGRSSLWCGNFMNYVLNRTGHRTSSSNMARSFASYGHRLPGPQIGAIAVMSRGRGGGHVGVVSGIDANGNPIIISGNHGHRVGEGVYPRGRIYAYVSP
jgi:uncharacterized protein (TIGR02594 family)